MSLQSFVSYYLTQSPAQPGPLLTSIISLLEPTRNILATRYKSTNSWQEWQEELRNPEMQDAVIANSPPDFILMAVEPAQVGRLFAPDKCLSLDVSSRITAQLKQAVIKGLPKEVFGSFAPNNCTLHVGYHDLWEHLENEDGLFFDRAFLSICFWGYSTPSHGERFREEVFLLPEFLDVQAQLESITGPLKRCFYSIG